MELTNVIEKLLNRDSFLNLLENDIIEKQIECKKIFEKYDEEY